MREQVIEKLNAVLLVLLYFFERKLQRRYIRMNKKFWKGMPKKKPYEYNFKKEEEMKKLEELKRIIKKVKTAIEYDTRNT